MAAGFLLAVLFLDELGACATASMDTKPVIRKILIIIINFFIAFPFYWFEVTVKTASEFRSLMIHHKFFVYDLIPVFDGDKINTVRKLINRNVHLADSFVGFGYHSMSNHIIYRNRTPIKCFAKGNVQSGVGRIWI